MANTLKQLTAATLLSMAFFALPLATLAQTADKPYTYVEQMPAFKGGDKELLNFLGTNIRYPEDAKKAGTEGLVVLTFVVDTDGSVKNVQVLKSLSASTDAEAVRVIKLMDGQWEPGRQNGKVVAVRYTLPIRFAMKTTTAEASTPDKQPHYKGGQAAMMQAISQHLRMPDEAKKEHLDARVVVKFTVEKDGSVSNIKLAGTKLKKTVGPDAKLDYMDAASFNLQNKSILAKLAEAAAAAIKATSGQWEPATKKGQPVAAELVLPVQFIGSETESKGASLVPPAGQESQKSKSAYKYEEVDVKPEMENGPLAKFVAKNLRYPKGSDFEGDVQVLLSIDNTGKMMAPMASSNDKSINDEIFRVLDLTKGNWTPGTVNGKPVTTVGNFTFRFISGKGLPMESSAKPDVIITKR